tara:strand:- start:148 stop:1920 length:1773 start_codon:yes stop_codon:yes gene_type:complete
MGIPSYFKYLIKKYPRDELLLESPPDNCEAFYLDLNGIIHNSSQFIVKQYENNIIDQKNSLQSAESIEISIQKNREKILEELYPKMFDHIFNSIQKLALFVNPTKLLYIAMDGVAPRAKMQQQRQRRFKKVFNQKEIHDLYHKHNTPYISSILFDSNCITPGTSFMYNLSLHLQEKLLTLKDNFPEIIFSDTSVPGEGEHKIIQHIKNKFPLKENNEKGWHVIHGLDADLIMLSMTCKNVNMLLLREEIRNNTIQRDDNGDAILSYFNIKEFKALIISHMENIGGFQYEENIKENIINDYVALCFLLGNDFLPHPLSLSIHSKGVDILLGIYVPMQKKRNNTLVQWSNKKTLLDNNFLKNIIENLSKMEEKSIIKNQKKNKKVFYSQDKIDNPLKNDIKKLEIISPKIHSINEFKLKVGAEGWESNYYLEVDNISNKNDITEMCKNYCNGLFWTLQYYFNSCYSTEWYYKYTSTPLYKDIYQFLDKKDVNKNLVQSQKIYSSIEQLLIVLPENSHFGCLPKNSKKIITDISLYYPIKAKINTFGHQYYWQCPLYLPEINDFVIDNISKNIFNQLKISSLDKIKSKEEILI